MTKFQGFESIEQAKEYQKKHGGMLCYATTKTGRKSRSYDEYMFAVHLGGLNQEKYPCCLQWNI